MTKTRGLWEKKQPLAKTMQFDKKKTHERWTKSVSGHVSCLCECENSMYICIIELFQQRLQKKNLQLVSEGIA
jgi:hypothetical protein